MRLMRRFLLVLCLVAFAIANINSFLYAQESQAEQDSSQTLKQNKLKEITFESSNNLTQIKFVASGGLQEVNDDVLLNPGRLVLDFPLIQSAGTINLSEMNDQNVIPRIRLAKKPDRLRVIVDTVVKKFPVYQISKSNNEVTLSIQKTPELLQEALSKSALFATLQKTDRESQLKLGSEDEGGLLFESNGSSLTHTNVSSSNRISQNNVDLVANGTGTKRVVFMLQDNKPYKIILQESETPVQIERMRPGYEIKGIQGRLRQLGYNTGLVDGDVGPQTKEAIKQFQKDNNLSVTGRPNKKTQRVLREKYGY